ncbi:MAG: SLBB domain-containing protein [Ignavibacteria bacterium]|nr:SLBB domain-containing protein [Ignavibacteria bacterium]
MNSYVPVCIPHEFIFFSMISRAIPKADAERAFITSTEWPVMKRTSLAALCLLFIAVASVAAQDNVSAPMADSPMKKIPGGPYYDLSTTKGCNLRVSIWGFVANPGSYLIPCETSLDELLTLAGGPVAGAKLGRVRVIRSGEASGVTRDEHIVDLSQHGKTRVHFGRGTSYRPRRSYCDRWCGQHQAVRRTNGYSTAGKKKRALIHTNAYLLMIYLG